MDIDAYDNPDAEALLRRAAERLETGHRRGRELLIQIIGAVSFLGAAVALATVAPWDRTFSAGTLLLVLATWIAIERVQFPVAGGFTYPTMLAFVPALFVLPTALVPLVSMMAILVRNASLIRAKPRLLPSVISDSWFAVGPALVIVLARDQHFAWSHWPVYLAAFGAEVVFDTAFTIARCWFGEGIRPRVQLPLLAWIYVSDFTLAPLGLAIAAVSVRTPALMLIALAPTVNLSLFARERKQRMDETLALSTAYRGTALLLGDIVEADDHYTGLHSRDVVDLSVAVAQGLGLDGTQRRHVEFAALLHDVGKIRIPKEIINKAGPLNDEEWALMRRHTIDGEHMLQMVGGALAEVGRIVRASHERYDGDGYPDGLAGEAIPVEARIIGACDAYSAMTTDRSYRPAMSPQEALAELRRCAGRQFDPHVIAAIERILIPRTGSWLDGLASPQSSAVIADPVAPAGNSASPSQPAAVADAPAAYDAG